MSEERDVYEIAAERLAQPPCDHVWQELEPDVKRCTECHALLFEHVTAEQLERHLLGES